MKSLPQLATIVALAFLAVSPAPAHWETQADDLPAWGQRGRLMLSMYGGGPVLPEFAQWQIVLHEHGPREVSIANVEERRKLGIPMNVRLETTMFFLDDSLVEREKKKWNGGRHRFDHDWYWHFNWLARDPKFREAALLMRDGRQMVEYFGNDISIREMGNPFSPMLLRLRKETSMAILRQRDPRSLENPIYPNHPYTPENDDIAWGKKGPPYDIYASFGNFSSLWYDNPQFWADSSELSQKAWRQHFKDKFGVEIVDPASHPNDLVRREWVRFWGDVWGRYLEQYRSFHQENIRYCHPDVKPLTIALNGKQVCPVMLNFSKVSHIYGGTQLYLFNRYRGVDYPGVQAEYGAQLTYGKYIVPVKFALACMHGRPTAKCHGGHAESLATNGALSVLHGSIRPGSRAFNDMSFQYDNRALLENAMPGNRTGVLYNIRSGLVSSNLANAFDVCQQLDEMGLTYDILLEDDLLDKHKDFLAQYVAVLVPGGEFNEEELAGFRRYIEQGGHAVFLGDVLVEPAPYEKLDTAEPKPTSWRPDVPAGRAFGHDRFDDADIPLGRGVLTVCEDQVVPTVRLGTILAPQTPLSFRLKDSMNGLMTANVLRQPRQSDALIVGVVNYTGQPQKGVTVLLPKGLSLKAAAVVSPDGTAENVAVNDGAFTLFELYRYSAVVLGEETVVAAALATVQPKLEALLKAREPLHPAESKGILATIQTRTEDVPADQQLARIRHGSNESMLAVCMDALAPRKAKPGTAVRVTLKMLVPGTHGVKAATFEYWRLHAVNVETGEEVRTQPEGATAAIEGAPVFELQDGKPVPMPWKAPELTGKTLGADFQPDKPGRYQLFVDFLYSVGAADFPFGHGDPGPRVEPAFPGDRPEAGWGYPGRPLKKHYVKFKLPRLVVEVTE